MRMRVESVTDVGPRGDYNQNCLLINMEANIPVRSTSSPWSDRTDYAVHRFIVPASMRGDYPVGAVFDVEATRVIDP